MKLYALTDSVFTPQNMLFSSIERLCNSGVSIIQYRNKTNIHDEKLLTQIANFCKEKSVIFIINDDALLAKRVGADGVHVGKDDESVFRARDILGASAIIGASCYSSVENAIKAQDGGASYAAFGAIFPSPTKKNAPLCDLNVIKIAKKELRIPVCAIGGINSTNISSVSAAGADYIAVISALYKNDEIEKNVKELLENSRI